LELEYNHVGCSILFFPSWSDYDLSAPAAVQNKFKNALFNFSEVIIIEKLKIVPS
jgi:hypothetical protein